jgi:hypothetical protein
VVFQILDVTCVNDLKLTNVLLQFQIFFADYSPEFRDKGRGRVEMRGEGKGEQEREGRGGEEGMGTPKANPVYDPGLGLQ